MNLIPHSFHPLLPTWLFNRFEYFTFFLLELIDNQLSLLDLKGYYFYSFCFYFDCDESLIWILKHCYRYFFLGRPNNQLYWLESVDDLWLDKEYRRVWFFWEDLKVEDNWKVQIIFRILAFILKPLNRNFDFASILSYAQVVSVLKAIAWFWFFHVFAKDFLWEMIELQGSSLGVRLRLSSRSIHQFIQ